MLPGELHGNNNHLFVSATPSKPMTFVLALNKTFAIFETLLDEILKMNPYVFKEHEGIGELFRIICLYGISMQQTTAQIPARVTSL